MNVFDEKESVLREKEKGSCRQVFSVVVLLLVAVAAARGRAEPEPIWASCAAVELLSVVFWLTSTKGDVAEIRWRKQTGRNVPCR